MPMRRTGNAGDLLVALLMTGRAAHGGNAMIVRTALRRRHAMPLHGLPLRRPVVTRMAVETTR